MKTSTKIFAVVACVALVAGCDDSVQSKAPATQPAVASATTQPAADQTAIVAAYPTRPPAVITIDGRDVAFPAARLAVVNHAGGLTLRLCSDDPPAAIDPGYAGNSFDLEMRLPIDRIEALPGSTWDHKPADADDSISGVFIHGFHDGLRPYDVHVAFQKTDQDVRVYLDGTFLRNDPQNPVAAPQHIHVSSCLLVNAVE